MLAAVLQSFMVREMNSMIVGFPFAPEPRAAGQITFVVNSSQKNGQL